MFKKNLLFVLVGLFLYSCEDTYEPILKDQTSVFDTTRTTQNLENYAQTYQVHFRSDNALLEQFKKTFKKISNNSEKVSVKSYSADSEMGEIYIPPTAISSSLDSFFLTFYNELANSYDYQIPEKIQKYRNILDSQYYLSVEEYESATIILNGFQAGYNSLEDAYNNSQSGFTKQQVEGGFWNCLRKTGGKQIARGMVGGAIFGGVSGGIAGAVGGTVVFPGIGTATGAAGGAVFGAAKGSIEGAVLGALWASADCLGSISKSENFIATVDEFIENEPLIIDAEIFTVSNETVIRIIME